MFNVQVNERGQVTIPKAIRKQADINPKDQVQMQLNEQGQIIITKKGLLDELEDLIVKDLFREGNTEYEVAKKLPGRKKELAEALMKMADEAEEDISSNNYSTLDELKDELSRDD